MSILEGRFHPRFSQYTAPGLQAPAFRQSGDWAVSATGSSCMWDGRLDNAQDLTPLLGVPACKTPISAEIALRSYERFGWLGLSRLIGDWSAVIYDATTRSVVMARDFAGVRPLFYAVKDNGEISWSSSLERLAASRETKLSDAYLIEYAARGYARANTPYCNVFRVPPGHAIVVAENRLDVHRLWSLPEDVDKRYGEQECADQLRDLFLQAVKTRLSKSGRTFAELSGGLDSSSVVCAARLARPTEDDREKGVTSLSYDEDGSLDRSYIGLVESHCRIPSIHLSVHDHPFVQRERVGNGEPLWWHPRLEEVRSRMWAAGSEVLLTGRSGDLITGNWVNDVEQVSDRLALRQYRPVLKEAASWSSSLKEPIYSVLWQAVRGACGHSALWTEDIADNSLLPLAQRRAAESLRHNLSTTEWRHLLPSRRKKLLMLRQLIDSQSLECPEPLRHVSVSHPFADRNVVEFMLNVPASWVCGPGEPRRLMRRSFRSFLPARVLLRRSKAAYSGAFHRALMPMAQELLAGVSRSILVERSIVDRDSLRARLQSFTYGLDCNAVQLRNLILLEFWLQRFEAGKLSFQQDSRLRPALSSVTTSVQ